jgi:tRNA pseudouridine38-40 synthase
LRYRLHLEYDGEAFHGWQVQPNRRTVQGVLAAALTRLCGETIQPTGAGRTDSGVHALAQAASFECERELDLRHLLRALRGLLPPDVRVFSAGRASRDFSARASAESRHYEYRMRFTPSALARRWSFPLPAGVDVEAMRSAAAVFRGEHDFTAFAAADKTGTSRRCRVLGSELRQHGDELVFEVGADHFLHHMVRRLAGSLVEVGRGRRSAAALEQALVAPDPRISGPCLPAYGLFLVAVRYPPDREFDTSAVHDAPPCRIENG